MRRIYLNPADIEHSLERVDHFLQLVGRRRIAKIKSLHDVVFELFALAFGRHKDHICGDGPPKGLRLHCHHSQSFSKRDVVQFNTDALRLVVDIKEHIDSRQLADRLVDIVGCSCHTQC